MQTVKTKKNLFFPNDADFPCFFKIRFGKLHRAAYRIINDTNNLQETRKKAVIDKILGNIIKTLVEKQIFFSLEK